MPILLLLFVNHLSLGVYCSCVKNPDSVTVILLDTNLFTRRNLAKMGQFYSQNGLKVGSIMQVESGGLGVDRRFANL